MPDIPQSTLQPCAKCGEYLRFDPHGRLTLTIREQHGQCDLDISDLKSRNAALNEMLDYAVELLKTAGVDFWAMEAAR